MKKLRLLIFILISTMFAHAQTPNQATQPSQHLSCELQRNFADTLSTEPFSHFHFILYSDIDGLRVFEDWNSWGYFARSFTLTDPQGYKYLVTARERNWDKNFPASVMINRGKALVTDIYLCDGSWQVSPKLPLKEIYSTVTGHYTLKQDTRPILKDNPFHSNEVWQGTIDSQSIQLLLTKDCIVLLNAD